MDLDPQAARVVDRVTREGYPGWSAMSVASARRFEDEVFSGDATPEVAVVRDLAIDGPDGDLPLRLYRPRPEVERPVVVHAHGGGWTLGTLDSVDGICRELAARSGCIVVSVDYRLAPEHPFPAALDDVAATLRWIDDHAVAVGGDGRLVLSGTSAGATLATATAMRVEAFGGPSIDHQLLCYPATRREGSPDERDCAWLSRADMDWFWEQYLRSPVDAASPYAVPMRAPGELLAGLPPATVVTAGHDPLGPEGRAYADRLAEAGVPVAARHYPTQPHGFLSLTSEVDTAEAAMAALVTDLPGT